MSALSLTSSPAVAVGLIASAARRDMRSTTAAATIKSVSPWLRVVPHNLQDTVHSLLQSLSRYSCRNNNNYYYYKYYVYVLFNMIGYL